MRIGIVVDSACDLPLEYFQQHNIHLLPITVRIGQAVLADHRNEQATLQFLNAHLAERGFEAETTPFTVQQVRDLFVSQLAIDYDYVFCMTITKTRSPVFDNANQSINYIARPQVPFRGERLIATISKSVGAQGITIRSMAGIIVGTTPQVADVGNMALEAFGANAFGVRLMLNQATPGMTIKIFAQASSPIPIGEQITVDLQILGRVIRA